MATISVKIPARVLEQMPAAGQGRSGFIIQAIEEKIARRQSAEWRPKTDRGRRMAELLEKGRAARMPLLSIDEVEEQLRERRGEALLRTFLDSGVLLHAWRGEALSAAVLKIMDDEARDFFTAQMVRLELLPKARFEKRLPEAAFYEAHFSECKACEPLSQELGVEAERLATRYGLSGPDALQLCAAIRQDVEEFYTSERPGRPMFRVKEIKVVSLISLLT